MTEQLKPCPHCGHKYSEALEFYTYDATVYVSCERCGMRGPGVSYDSWDPNQFETSEKAKNDAAILWNNLPRRNGWQPIETAPQDDTPIMTYGGVFDAELGYKDDDYPKICVVERIPRDDWDVHLSTDEMEDVENLYRSIHTSYYGVNVIDPTHWMPLPEPPENE